MHEKDRNLILQIQKYFGMIGYISEPNNRSTVEFRVSTINDLMNIIIPHFDKYPLLTKKYSDFLILKDILNLMLKKEHSTMGCEAQDEKKIKNKEHLKKEGLEQILVACL
jgi:hypothetical protein